MINTDIRYDEYFKSLVEKTTNLGITTHKHKLRYTKDAKKYNYESLELNLFKENRPNMLITAGFHGEEIAGPITILHKLEEIVELGKQHDMGLIILPCINPSGFDIRQRYNILVNESNEEKAPYNNDFIRYVVKNKIVEILKDDNKYDTWVYVCDKNIVGRQPSETTRVDRIIKKLPTHKIRAHLDLHQDCFSEDLFEGHKEEIYTDERGTYAYSFYKESGKLAADYLSIMREAGQIVPVLPKFLIDTGYKQVPINGDGPKELAYVPDKKLKVYSDENGFISLHDGSISDLMFRLDTPYVAAVETTIKTPIEQSMQVYMTWIKGFMELITEKK